MEQGNQLFDKGQFSAALEKFRQANGLFPSAELQLNLGLTREQLKQLPEATGHFEAFLGQVDGQAFPRRVQAVQAKLAALKKKICSLTIRSDAAGALVKVDGRTVGATPLPAPVYLAPGSHRLELTKVDHKGHQQTLELKAGDHREVQISLTPLAPTPPATQPADPVTPPPPAVSSSRPIYKRWWFWTVVGVVVVGSATAAVVATQTGGDDRLPHGELFTTSLK